MYEQRNAKNRLVLKVPDGAIKMPDSAIKMPDSAGEVPDTIEGLPDNKQERKIYQYALENM